MRRIYPLFVLSSFLLLACSTAQRTSAETTLAKAFISDDEEAQLGLQVKDELNKQGVKYVSDPQVVDYVRGVAGKLFPTAEKERPGVKWNVQVIDDPKTVNAFATPGGYLYVYSGLLLAAENEAELAGVLSHEIGHVVARHSARQMVDAYGLQAISAVALGNNPSLLPKIAASIAGQGALLANSRGDEQEADEYGARYASAAGYDPHALATFFQKLQAQEGKTPKVLTWLSDHPATPDRIKHVNEFIAQKGLGGTVLAPERLAPVKAKLQGGAGK